MSILEKVYDFFLPKEKEYFNKNVILFLGTISFLIVFIIYCYYSNLSSFKSSIKKLNKNREEVKELLLRSVKVEKQSSSIDDLLSQEKNFKIKNYFDEVVKKLNLTNNQKKEADVSQEDLHKLYSEVRISSTFKQINMKQLCELLEEFEQKQRVYIKDLIITQSIPNGLLESTIVLATLIPQSLNLQKG